MVLKVRLRTMNVVAKGDLGRKRHQTRAREARETEVRNEDFAR
jgi:hypothetical protein